MALPTRRTFMKTASLGAVGLPLLAAQEPSQTSSKKYRVREIGHDGDDGHMAGAFAEFPNVTMVAVADPVETTRVQRMNGISDRPPKSFPRHDDFRKMVDEAKDLDAVAISTPHHIHALATARALRAGKHVCCEKPLTHTVWEARVVAELAAKHKVTTQHGTNAHTFCDFQRAVELIQGGAIGPVGEVHV